MKPVTVKVRGKRGTFTLPQGEGVSPQAAEISTHPQGGVSIATPQAAAKPAPVAKGRSTPTRERLAAKIERAKAMRKVESVAKLEAKFERLFGDALDDDKTQG